MSIFYHLVSDLNLRTDSFWCGLIIYSSFVNWINLFTENPTQKIESDMNSDERSEERRVDAKIFSE